MNLLNRHFSYLFVAKTFSRAMSVKTMDFKEKISTKSHADIFDFFLITTNEWKLGFFMEGIFL